MNNHVKIARRNPGYWVEGLASDATEALLQVGCTQKAKVISAYEYATIELLAKTAFKLGYSFEIKLIKIEALEHE